MIQTLRRLAMLALLPLAAPVLAQEHVRGDGFFNIAGDPEIAQGDVYGEVRGWTVVSGSSAEGFAFCAAEISQPGMTWRFGHDAAGQWQLAVQHPFAGETPYGSFSVDGQASGMTGWGNGEWVVMWINRGEYDAIAQGNLMEIRLGEVWYQMQLSGTAAAALKVQECVQNRGRPPEAAAPAAAPAVVAAAPGKPAPAPVAPAPVATPVAMPDVTFRGEEFVGNCETPYASYRCMAVMLQPTAGYQEAMEITDPFGDAFSFVVQTDRADLSQVWVAYDKVTYIYLGLWSFDGTCRLPLPDQEPSVEDTLGQDAWQLCIS